MVIFGGDSAQAMRQDSWEGVVTLLPVNQHVTSAVPLYWTLGARTLVVTWFSVVALFIIEKKTTYIGISQVLRQRTCFPMFIFYYLFVITEDYNILHQHFQVKILKFSSNV